MAGSGHEGRSLRVSKKIGSAGVQRAFLAGSTIVVMTKDQGKARIFAGKRPKKTEALIRAQIAGQEYC
jgi:hypothetical protein